MKEKIQDFEAVLSEVVKTVPGKRKASKTPNLPADLKDDDSWQACCPATFRCYLDRTNQRTQLYSSCLKSTVSRSWSLYGGVVATTMAIHEAWTKAVQAKLEPANVYQEQFEKMRSQ